MTLTLTHDTCSNGDVLMYQTHHQTTPVTPIKVHATLPCPIVVRFNAAFSQYIKTNNASGETPVHCPSMLNPSPMTLESQILQTHREEDLPDIFITPSLGTVFSRPFQEKLIHTGIYQGINHPDFLAAMPAKYLDAAQKYKLGFLAFGSWSVVWDLSFGENIRYPRAWDDLIHEDFSRQLSIQGFNGVASGLSLLALLKERHDMEAITRLGGNLKNVRHFSEIIKQMNSRSPKSAAFNILPSAAVAQIPRHKKAAIIEFEEGQLLAPIMLFAKSSRLKECMKTLDFFWNEDCRATLAMGEFYMPDQVDWERNCVFPSFEKLLAEDFPKQAQQLNAALNKGMRAGPCAC